MNNNKTDFNSFFDIIRTLRGPNGCPWDKEQTAESLKSSIIEEAYECIDAITENDKENIKEELGDLLLVISLISYIMEQDNIFTINDVLKDISQKLIRRHPHVFNNKETSNITNPDEVITQWNQIKQNIEGKTTSSTSILSGLKRNIPAMEKAFEIQKKVSKHGFEWENINGVFDKINEEISELKTSISSGNKQEIEEEFGDLLFSVINLSSYLKLNPSISLNSCNNKFINRFKKLEDECKKQNIDINKSNINQLDTIWNQIKMLQKNQ